MTAYPGRRWANCALWDSQSRPVVTQPGNEPGSVVKRLQKTALTAKVKTPRCQPMSVSDQAGPSSSTATPPLRLPPSSPLRPLLLLQQTTRCWRLSSVDAWLRVIEGNSASGIISSLCTDGGSSGCSCSQCKMSFPGVHMEPIPWPRLCRHLPMKVGPTCPRQPMSPPAENHDPSRERHQPRQPPVALPHVCQRVLACEDVAAVFKTSDPRLQHIPSIAEIVVAISICRDVCFSIQATGGDFQL